MWKPAVIGGIVPVMLPFGAPRYCFRVTLFAFATLLVTPFPSGTPILASDYFVRLQGDDGGTGTSVHDAWRSIDRVNRVQLRPGDRVLFEGGFSFAGNLALSAEDAGSSNAPVTVGSFGEGRATLRAGRNSGIEVENAAGIVIENLVLVGNGRTNNAGFGIRCDNTLTNGQRLANLTISNVEAREFGMFGILVTGKHAGFERVRVSHCVLRDNLRGGMEIAGRLPWDSAAYAHADVLVEHCQAYDNTGDPEYLQNHSGSGIVLYQVDGGLMEHCRAWNNGTLCRSAGGGGVGLWTCASRRVTIQHCESFANRTTSADGGGFDIDGGSEECVLQYNYSHDNDGPGLMVYSYPYASHKDRANVVRFNISENDSRKGKRYAGLWVRTDGPPMTELEVYNNTVVIGSWTEQAAHFHGQGVEAGVRNNIFIASASVMALRVDNPSDRIRFENNLYWCEEGPTGVAWGSATYENLSKWREATGQEMLLDKPTGLFLDPALAFGKWTDLRDATGPRKDPRTFRPLPHSPALAGGLDLRLRFGINTGERDLLGGPLTTPLPLGAIGASALE